MIYFKLKNITLKFIIVLIYLSFNFSFTQTEIESKENRFWQHVRFGGGLGLSSGTDFFTLGVSPSAIYDFNDQFSLGTSLNYTYNRFKNRFKSNIYGGSILGLFNPINEIQISTELEQLRVNRNYEGINQGLPSDNYWSPALFIGAGYRTNNVTIGLRYDLLFDEQKSIYADAIIPFIRVYF
ncbi:alpha-ketoglutarate decarboxylase [Aurantibacter sp.]|uniref:alpha-ketoglutarate decarboxylase n=1 Tax=Aurantibacter sp. TaxID=2807103 RepID=UPI0035C840A6